MKRTIFSSFAFTAIVSMIACQGPTTDRTDDDSAAAIRQEPVNTQTDATRDTAMGAQTTLDDRSRTFMNEAAMGGMAEVEFGRLAQEKASNPRVKAFGEMMVKDHSQANEDLKSLANKKNLTLPTDMGKHQRHMDDLNKKTGAEFDKAYMKMMVDDHKEDVDEFEDAAKDANDPEVKNFASQKLPTLRKHLDSAKAINESLGRTGKKY
jgi:putative membrane protein